MRNSKKWSIAFLILLALNFSGNLFSFLMLANLTKVLLMPSLAGLILTSVRQEKSSKLIKWILVALLFSWGGDVLLIFQEANSNFFLLGLVSFLLAHLSYVFAYRTARNDSKGIIKGGYWLLLITVLSIYLFLLFIKIGPGLGPFLIPVIIYAITISIMLLVSFSRKSRTSWKSFMLVMAGASLFVLSDSLIALNKFSWPIVHAGVWIMLTYGIAQYLIIKGLVEHLETVE